MFVCTINPNKLESLAEQILDVRGGVTTRDLLGGERNVHVEVVAGSVREIEEIRNELANLGMTVNSSEIISETRVQSWDHFYPRPGPDADQDDDTDDASVTDQGQPRNRLKFSNMSTSVSPFPVFRFQYIHQFTIIWVNDLIRVGILAMVWRTQPRR